MIDFQRIRESTDIVAVAKWLGLEVNGEKTKCPFHQDHTPSLSFKDGRFKCFGCDASGDAIDLVAKLRNVSNGTSRQDTYIQWSPSDASSVQHNFGSANTCTVFGHDDFATNFFVKPINV